MRRIWTVLGMLSAIASAGVLSRGRGGGGMTRLLLLAAALVAMLAGAVAEWDVYPGAGTPIQTTIDSAGAGDTIYVHAGTYVENVGVDKRLTLIGDGADVAMVRAADAEDTKMFM